VKVLGGGGLGCGSGSVWWKLSAVSERQRPVGPNRDHYSACFSTSCASPPPPPKACPWCSRPRADELTWLEPGALRTHGFVLQPKTVSFTRPATTPATGRCTSPLRPQDPAVGQTRDVLAFGLDELTDLLSSPSPCPSRVRPRHQLLAAAQDQTRLNRGSLLRCL
jgi:hypothetical protein